MDEESMEARSDFIAENSPNCEDCGKYDEGLDDGTRARLFYHLENINEAFIRINAILATYDADDEVINEVKKDFNKLWTAIFNEDTKEFTRPCPCKEECDF